MKRLLTYLKPHIWEMLTATFLVLLIIIVELYRPIIIGDAIDQYINGSYAEAISNPNVTLTTLELESLKQDCFIGILYAAGLYFLMLLAGFILNSLDTWIYKKWDNVLSMICENKFFLIFIAYL